MGTSKVYHENARQTSLMDEMKGLEAAKQVEFCLFRLGEIGRLEKPPRVGQYWQAFALHEPPAGMMPDLARRLAAEVEALERMGTMAASGMTVRQKLWIYKLAIDRLEDEAKHDPAQLARLCTWADFKKLFAAEVAAVCDEDGQFKAEMARKREEARRDGAGSDGAGPAGMGGSADRGGAGEAAGNQGDAVLHDEPRAPGGTNAVRRVESQPVGAQRNGRADTSPRYDGGSRPAAGGRAGGHRTHML